MKTCFVIQPFDNGKFDKRFNDSYKPAIELAGYEAYRIDNDFSAITIIDEIEKGIRNADICFAEITTNNPNVWYELGYASACNKPIVMVCSTEREGAFPFDIRHRHIINYGTESQSDFKELTDNIVKKIKAINVNQESLIRNKILTETTQIEGTKDYELAMLLVVMENQASPDMIVDLQTIKDSMRQLGYRDIATSLGIRSLTRKSLIMQTQGRDYEDGYTFTAYQLTEAGEDFMMTDQDKFDLKVLNKEKTSTNSNSLIDDLPF